MLRKGSLQISFAWLFAIIVGVFILFLAIFLAMKIMNIGQTQVDAKTAKKIEILLNPLETSFESGKVTNIVLPSEIRIYNKCDNTGNFGTQKVQISQKSFGKWTETDVNVPFSNKYIFSDDFVEGKKFYLFSMPFEYPFKVANLIFLTSKEYCFLNPPQKIEEDISSFQEDNIKMENCSEESVRVCFGFGSDCDIKVNYNQENVEKDGEILYFTGNLVYGAIFADKNIYECQVKRLMQRTEQLSSLYKDKSEFIKEHCDSGLEIDLLNLKNSVKDFENSEDLFSINSIVNQIENRNSEGDCRLW